MTLHNPTANSYRRRKIRLNLLSIFSQTFRQRSSSSSSNSLTRSRSQGPKGPRSPSRRNDRLYFSPRLPRFQSDCIVSACRERHDDMSSCCSLTELPIPLVCPLTFAFHNRFLKLHCPLACLHVKPPSSSPLYPRGCPEVSGENVHTLY